MESKYVYVIVQRIWHHNQQDAMVSVAGVFDDHAVAKQSVKCLELENLGGRYDYAASIESHEIQKTPYA